MWFVDSKGLVQDDGRPGVGARLAADAQDYAQRSGNELARLATSLNRMTTRLLEEQTLVVRAEKMASVGRLAAGIAHEIGNPLGAIMTAAQIAIRRNHDELLEKPLSRILSSGSRAAFTRTTRPSRRGPSSAGSRPPSSSAAAIPQR